MAPPPWYQSRQRRGKQLVPHGYRGLINFICQRRAKPRVAEQQQQAQVFPPELVGEVFEDILATLNLTDRNGPVTELVAHKVIEVIQSGERDRVRLKQLTLEAIHEQRPAH
jgi:hypothetical protein